MTDPDEGQLEPQGLRALAAARGGRTGGRRWWLAAANARPVMQRRVAP